MNENLEKKFEKKEAVKRQLTFKEKLHERKMNLKDFYTSITYDPDYSIKNT